MIMFRASFVLALLVVAPGSRECEARRPGVLAWRRRPSRIDTTAAVGLGGGKLSNWLRNRRGGKPARAAHDDEQPLVEIVDDPNEDPKGDNEEWDEGALVEKEGGIAPRDRGILESSAEYLGLRGGNPKALLVQLGRAAIVASAAYIIGEKAFKFVRARKSAAAEAGSSEAVMRHAVKDAAKDANKPAGVAHIGATASGDKQQHVEPPAEEPSPTTPLEDGYHELVDDFEEEQRLEQELAAEHEQQLDQAVLDEIESYEAAETMFYGQDTRVEPPLPPPPTAATSSPNDDEEAAKPSP